MSQVKENIQQTLGVKFAEYLSLRLKKRYECQQIKRIFGGASRETYRVRLIEKDKRDSVNLIYRRSQKSSLIETKQETEYLAYSLFQDSSVPVPKLILLEESSEALGAPFLVMEELEGEAASPFDSEVYKPFEEEIGIRIEDNLLITDSGCVNLSRTMPKTVSEIERLMAFKKR